MKSYSGFVQMENSSGLRKENQSGEFQNEEQQQWAVDKSVGLQIENVSGEGLVAG